MSKMQFLSSGTPEGSGTGGIPCRRTQECVWVAQLSDLLECVLAPWLSQELVGHSRLSPAATGDSA